MHQNHKHINQDLMLRWNKMSTQWQTNSETQEQQKSNSWTPVGPTKDRVSSPNQLKWRCLGLFLRQLTITMNLLIYSS